jgi:hypothetical protein
MTKNVTAWDIIETGKQLERIANYARRHIKAVPIVQADNMLTNIKLLMIEAERTFREMDILKLTLTDNYPHWFKEEFKYDEDEEDCPNDDEDEEDCPNALDFGWGKNYD